jgi:hypothetical protein
MPVSAPRTKTPAVEPSNSRDVTEREVSPPVRRNPIPAPPPDPLRARRQTLVSPIPALLAATMGDVAEDRAEATPLPVDVRADETSRFEVADQNALLNKDASDDDYVVELVDADKTVA